MWGQVQTPLRVLSGLLSRMVPEPAVELSMRRSLPAAPEAVERGELDGVFGRPYDLPRGLPAGLARRPFVLDSLNVIATDGHPFAACRQITAAKLRETGLWYPLDSRSNAPELVGWLRRYAAQNAVPLTLAGINLGLEQLLTELPEHHPAVSTVPDSWQIPADPGIVRIPLQPAAHFLWWFIWPERSSHPVLEQFNVLLDRIPGPWNGLGRPDGWLPEPDAADLPWAPPDAGR
ncbi:MAG TPA: LysR substrate-binding domain-containing protein [Actinocrinis sp.]|nr:LysR substrate-binding domain-containing protein [Actinocrinis sp.]